MSLKLGGVEGAATLTVSQGAHSASRSLTGLPAPEIAGNEPTAYVGPETNGTWNNVALTVTRDGNGSRFGYPCSPFSFVEILIVQSINGDKIELANDYDSAARIGDANFTLDTYAGAEVDVYRYVSGVLTYVGVYTLPGTGNLGEAYTPQGFSSDDYVTATTIQYQMRNFWRPSADYWFGVQAIDAGGQHTATTWASAYTLGSDFSGDAMSNPTEASLGTDPTPGSSLDLVTGVTVTADASGPLTVNVSYNAVTDAIGYRLMVAFQDPATLEATQYLNWPTGTGTQLLPGDLVVIQKRMAQLSRTLLSKRRYNETAANAFIENNRPRIGGTPNYGHLNTHPDYTYEYKQFGSGDAAPDALAGFFYMRFGLTGGTNPSTPLIQQTWNGPVTGNYYEVLDPAKTYRWTAWVRASRPCDIVFKWQTGGGIGGTTPETVAITTADTWQFVTMTDYSPTGFWTGGGTSSQWQLSSEDMTSEGNLTLDIAGIRCWDTSFAFYGYDATDKARVEAGQIFRHHNLIKTKRAATGPGTEEILAPPGTSSRTNSDTESSSLPGFLAMCEDVGVDPWIQIEWHHRYEDWQDIVAYLAAPVSSGHPMALLRQSHGRTAPWTDAFSQIPFEIGNENWNPQDDFRTAPTTIDSVTAGAVNGSYVYGTFARRACDAMRASAHWNPKIKHVLGGRANVVGDTGVLGGNSWSGEIVTAFASQSATVVPFQVGIANYSGGWDLGSKLVTESTESYQALSGVGPVRIEPSVRDFRDRVKAATEALSADYTFGVDVRLTCYESGPGYQLNGLNGAVLRLDDIITQEVVGRSIASATGSLDTVCIQAAYEFFASNFFVLGPGRYWRTHATEGNGGATYPPYQVYRVMEKVAPATPLNRVSVVPESFSITYQDGSVLEEEALFAYGLRSQSDSGHIMIAVGNRSISKTIKPRIRTTIASATSAKVYTHMGDYRDHNVYPLGERLMGDISVDGAITTGATVVGLHGLTFDPSVNDTFVIDGDATVYTVTDVAGFTRPDGNVSFSPSLVSDAADGAGITWTGTGAAWSGVTAGYAPDPSCVAIDIETGASVTVPSDLRSFVVDDGLGALVGGIPPGHFVILELEGAVVDGDT